jgi:prevent-host-death family protein
MTIPAAKAREKFAELYDQVAIAKERIVITKHGKAGMAMVPIEDLRLLEKLEDHLDRKATEAALEEASRSGTKSVDDLMKEMGIDPGQIRKRK